MKKQSLFQIPFLLSFSFLLLMTYATHGQSQQFPVPKISFNPRHYICQRTTEEITIDGKMNEKSWQLAQWTEDFVDIEGAEKPAPRFRTRAKMLWDDEFFYFAAELEEPHIWAKLMQRDTVIFRDNDFEIFIDPDGDSHEYYEFEMNAHNIVWDLLLIKPYRDGGPAINGWDIHGLKTGVYVKGTLNDPGDLDEFWTIEIAMPWEALKECAHKSAPPKNSDVWRVNFSRVEWQIEIKNGNYRKKINPQTGSAFPEDNWVWSPQGLINMHYPEMWGFVIFSSQFVGSKENNFLLPPQENIKWKLRQVYYQQQNYLINHGKFATRLEQLNLSKNSLMQGQTYELKSAWNQFEAKISDESLGSVWFINQEGKIYQKTSQ